MSKYLSLSSGLPTSQQVQFSDLGGSATVVQGGTGLATLAAHGVLIGEGTSNVNVVTNSSSTNNCLLQVQGSGLDPAWTSTPVLGNPGTNAGSIAIANGSVGGSSVIILNNAATSQYNFILPATPGTSGQALTSAGGSSAMTWTTVLSNPMTTAGDIIYENATPAPARLAIGTTGQVLTVVSGLPAWQTPASQPTLTSLGIFAGKATVSNAATSVSITFSTAFGSTNYSITGTMMNTTDTNPAFIPVTVTAQSASGATFSWNTPVPTANYVLNWHAILNN